MISFLFLTAIAINLSLWGRLLLKGKNVFALTVHTVFMVFFIGVPGYVQYTSNVYPWIYKNYLDIDNVLGALLMLNIYSISFSLGYILSNSKKNSVEKNRKASTSKLLAITLIATTLSAYLVSQVGILNFFQSRGSVGEIIYDTNNNLAMLYAAAKFSIFSVLALTLLEYRFIKEQSIHKKPNWKIKSSLLLIIACNFIINNPLSSPRFHFLSMAITLMLIMGFAKRRYFNQLVFAASPAFLYFIFPKIKDFSADRYKGEQSLVSYLSTGVDFDSFLQLANIYKFAVETSYSLGSNIIGGIAFFVPRFIWETKPIHLGALSSEHAGYAYTNLSAPWPGELFYIIGWPSLVIGAYFSGLILKKIDSTIKKSANETTLANGVSFIAAGFIFIVMRGSFGAVFPVISLCLVVYTTSYYITRQKTK